MNRKKLGAISAVCAVLIAASLVLTAACAAPTGTEAKTIKFGCIWSLSGPGASGEVIATDAVPLARDWINNNGGVTINGEKYLIETTIEDGRGTTEGFVAAATKLVNMDKVKFISGGNRPDLIFAIQSVTEPAKVMLSMGFGGGVPGLLSTVKPLSFWPSPHGAEEIKVNYAYLAKTYPDVKTVAIIGEEGPGGLFFSSVSRAMAKAYGLNVVSSQMYPVGTSDFYSVWTKTLAAKPDMVDSLTAFPEQLGGILKQGRELGYTGMVFSSGPVSMASMIDMASKEYADKYLCNTYVITQDTPPVLREISEMLEDPNIPEGVRRADITIQWDSMWCMAQAIEAAQSLDPTEVAATWEKMPTIETAYGTGYMGGLETYGSNHLVVRPIPISTLMKAEAQTVEWVMPEVP
jgi:ABC-type branched-subunit amino acid transport system substrate-binding protein